MCTTCEVVSQGHDMFTDHRLLDLCVNCGCIRGGHHPSHPHGRFGCCPHFSPVEMMGITKSLHDIEKGLRAA